MIIHLAPDAPIGLKALADTALVAHVGGGMIGIAAGFVAAAARKGGRAHRRAGDLFVAAMFIAYVVGAAASPFIHQPANVSGGLLGAYLVATGWLAAKRPPRVAGVSEIAAFLAAGGGAAALLGLAILAAPQPHGLGGVPAFVWAALAVVCALAAALDLKVVLAGGLVGTARLRRHLWRMCVAFFFGTGSLFLGQPSAFPAPLRYSPPIIVLGVAPLLVLAYWLWRTRRQYPRKPPRAAPAVALPIGG